jgi:hypothetical protein
MLRHGESKQANEARERGPDDRGVLRDQDIGQAVDSFGPGDLGLARRALAGGVHADAGVAPNHPEKATIVHRLEQLRRGPRRAAPPVRRPPVLEALVHLPRMHLPALAHELEHRLRGSTPLGRPPGPMSSGMEQPMIGRGEKTVVDEERLFESERPIAPLEIARPVAGDPVA